MDARYPDRPTSFRKVASGVERAVSLRGRTAMDERDQEWQRVNSYVADVLKDTHVLYAKLARLQGDFAGGELGELESISESVLNLGEQLSRFMKAFHEGDAAMLKSKVFGRGTPSAAPPSPPAPPAPPPGPAPERSEEDYESEIRSEAGSEFEEFEEVDEEGAPAEKEEGEAA